MDNDGISIPDDCDPDDPNLGTAPVWYEDADGDGFGVADSPRSACTQPEGTAAISGDCGDADPAVYPGAIEVCDLVDNDCDGMLWPGAHLVAPQGSADWPDAVYTSIGSAISGATDGDTLCVAPGTYTEYIDFHGMAIAVIGAGGAEQTVLRPPASAELAALVSFQHEEPAESALQGFTLTGNTSGSGIYIDGASPTLSDLVISDNATDSPGAGLYVRRGGAPTLSRVVLTRNNSTDTGGGIALVNASATLDDVTIGPNNATAGNGGGVSINGGSARLNAVLLTANTALEQGGGIYATGATLDISLSTIDGNRSYAGAGLSSADGSQVTLSGVSIWNNSAAAGFGGAANVQSGALYAQNIDVRLNDANDCGGLYIDGTTDVVIANAIFAGNLTDGQYETGGAIRFGGPQMSITNAAFVGNETHGAGGAIFLYGYGDDGAQTSQVALSNTTFTSNIADREDGYESGPVFLGGPADLSASYTHVYDNAANDAVGDDVLTGSNGNIDGDPRFVSFDMDAIDPADWDLHLSSASPLVDHGDPLLLDADGSRSDIGAYGGAGGESWPADLPRADP